MSKHTKEEVVKKYKPKLDKVDKKLGRAENRLAKRNEKKRGKFIKKYEKETTKLNEAVGSKGPSKFVGTTPKEKSSSKRIDRLEKKRDKIADAGRKAYKAAKSSNNYGTMKAPTNEGHIKTMANEGHAKTMANKNKAPNFYVMDPGSPAKKMDTPGPFSYKAQTTMNKLGMVDSGMNDGHSTPLDDAGHGGKTGHTHADPKPFKYESDGGGLEVVGMPIPKKGIKTFTGYKGKGEERKIGDVGQGVSARSLQNPDRPREIVRGEVIGNNPYKTGDPYGSGKQVKTVGKGVITRTQTKKEKEAMKKRKFTVT